jgi:hypothetical protein
MFHVSKWGDISLDNPLKNKKINNFFQARPIWASSSTLSLLTSLRFKPYYRSTLKFQNSNIHFF